MNAANKGWFQDAIYCSLAHLVCDKMPNELF